MTIEIQNLSLVEHGKIVHFTLYARTGRLTAPKKLDETTTWIPTWYAMENVSWSYGF